MRLPSDATLLVIDALEAVIAPAAPGPPMAPAACIRMLFDVWRSMSLPVVLAVGDTVDVDTPPHGVEIVRRDTISAFVRTDLDERLTARGCTTLALCGVGTDDAVEATTRHAADLGYRLFVVAEACATAGSNAIVGRAWTDSDIQALAFARMQRAGAKIVDWRTTWIAAKGAGWGRRA